MRSFKLMIAPAALAVTPAAPPVRAQGQATPQTPPAHPPATQPPAKAAEINEKNKQLQAAQTKLNTGAQVLSESARAQLEKDIDRMQRDIQFSSQNAQAEMTDLQNELQGE